MNKVQKLVVFPLMLIALLSTASFTLVIANWDKIFNDREQIAVDTKSRNSETQTGKKGFKKPVIKIKKEEKVIRTVTSGGVRFDLFGCEIEKQIICRFNVTSIDRNRKFYRIKGTANRLIIDGIEYSGISASVGGHGSSTGRSVHLIKDVSLKSSLIFPFVEQAEKIDLLGIQVDNNDYALPYEIGIKNVPLH
ncbi:MAG: hypothetical protein QNJ54_28360 [Prochloraceae cyanobacterium]|nr:hypothetical protein [Prochloraceae cyanobacterium]